MLIRHQHGVQAVRALVMVRDIVYRNLRTHDPTHMENGSQRQISQSKWYDALRVAVDDAVHALVALVDLAVDEAFRKSSWRFRINCAGITDAVFYQIFAISDKCGCQIFGEEEGLWVLRVADRDVTESYEVMSTLLWRSNEDTIKYTIDDVMIVQNMICCY